MSSRQRSVAGVGMLMLVLVLVVGCDGGGVSGPSALPPATNPASVVSVSSSSSSTGSSTSSSSSSSSTVVSSTTDVLGLPPVSTLVPLVPGELDPDDKNNRIAPPDTPEEIAIIAAYIEGLDRLNAFYATFPVDPNSPLLVDGPFTAELIEFEQVSAGEQNAARERLDVSGGLTLRPYIVSFTPGGTTALVFDCQLDATVWRDADTGEVVPPPNDSFPNTGPDVATATSLSTRMELVGGEWLVGTGSSQPGACFDS